MACHVAVCKAVLKTDKAICRAARYTVVRKVALVHREDHLKVTPAA